MLVEQEEETYERIACDPLHLPEPVESVTTEQPDDAAGRGFPWPFATPRRSDGLGVRERLFWALIGIPVILMLSWGVFLSGIGALDALGR